MTKKTKRKSLLKPYHRKFGFELEFSSKFEEVLHHVKSIIPRIYGKNKTLIEGGTRVLDDNYGKWGFKYDGSTECELTTPISTIKDFPKITKVLTKLSEKNISTTVKDSVHVHMQANDIPEHNIIAAWIQIENAIMKCFPKHRRNNSYCAKLIHGKNYKKMSDFFIKAEAESEDHHAMLSLNYYDQRKTVEFRIMEGNIDINTIKPWIMFCMLFLNYARTIDPVEVICKKLKLTLTIEEMIELLNITDEEVLNFIHRRSKMFKKR